MRTGLCTTSVLAGLFLAGIPTTLWADCLTPDPLRDVIFARGREPSCQRPQSRIEIEATRIPIRGREPIQVSFEISRNTVLLFGSLPTDRLPPHRTGLGDSMHREVRIVTTFRYGRR